MTAMHPIEVTDGGNAAAMFRAQIVETPNQLHSPLLVEKVVDYRHSSPPR